MNQLLVFLEAATTEGQPGVDIIGIIGIYGAMFGVLWLFFIRPQSKRRKQTAAMQNAIEIGDNIRTNAGMYGTVADVVNDIFVIEFGLHKKVLIPVHKSAVVAVDEPDMTVSKDDDE